MAGLRKTIVHDAIVLRFAAKLRELRQSRGMTQQMLAEKAEVSVAYVSRLERAEAAPGIDLVARLAAALGAPMAELLPDMKPPDPRAVLAGQARELLEQVVRSGDLASLSLVVQLLGRVAQTVSESE